MLVRVVTWPSKTVAPALFGTVAGDQLAALLHLPELVEPHEKVAALTGVANAIATQTTVSPITEKRPCRGKRLELPT